MFNTYDDTRMDHAAYQKKVKKMTDAALRYTIKDAGEAIRANPSNRKNGYYQDEISYCSMELHRRNKSA